MSTNADSLGVVAHVILLLSCPLLAQAGNFAGGAGEPNDPYQIATAEQLISIESDPNLLDKHFVLLNDIDLDPNLPGGRAFTHAVIAPDMHDLGSFEGIPFTGSFDGHGHKIRNLIIRSATAEYLALFGYLGKEAVVRDLQIEDAQVGDQRGGYHCALAGRNDGYIVRCRAEARVSGSYGMAVLVGFNSGEIIDCWAAGEVVGYMSVGGLVGDNEKGAIINCHAASKVRTTGAFRTAGGGLVGLNYGGVIVNCGATGDVSATMGQYLGGLVGSHEGNGIIAHCYATGTVSVEKGAGTPGRGPNDCLGGLLGALVDGSIHACYASGNVSGGDNSGLLGGLVGTTSGGYGIIADSYAIGRVSGGKNSKALGGLIGYGNADSVIKACFWDTQTSGLPTSAGGIGLTRAQMQNAATFLAAGWDWVGEQANGTADLWFIPEGGGYPVLTVHSTAFQPHKLEGSGTPEDPYRIATAEDLGTINHYDLTACYRLEADIDLAGIAWEEAPIPFLGGQLDGAGRRVTGLGVQGRFYLGLFGVLGQNASVVDLGIRDANIMGGSVAGMLAGKNRGRVSACCADGAVSGSSPSLAGGLIGWNEGSISGSYALGTVTARASLGAGGLTGQNVGSVSQCHAVVHVTNVGFVAGYESAIGGLVGANSYLDSMGQVYDSYFLMAADGGGPNNALGIPLTDARMKQQASFVNWDFAKTWMICEGKDYPRLRWEKVDCDRP